MKLHLLYGKAGLDVEIPSDNVTVIDLPAQKGLVNEKDAFSNAVRNPIDAEPIEHIIRAKDRVAVVIPDITRPLPSEKLLSWLFAELSHVPKENITIVNGTGSHRENTPEELKGMLGASIMEHYKVVNHNSFKPESMELAGNTRDAKPVYMNKEYVQADKRIVLGFIEPHFMAGFSGGYKGIFPAVADIESILHYHRAAVIGDPNSTWGLLEGNPTQQQIRDGGSLLPVDFMLNVTLNKHKEITAFFCGDIITAHEKGCAYIKKHCMVPFQDPFPIVITTNNGYPLDQNLYQTVKGMHAAMQVIEEGGFILAAAECSDGFPEHGNFKKLLFDHQSARECLDVIESPGFSLYDQWEAQLLSIICLKAHVSLYSTLDPQEVQQAYLEPVRDITQRIKEELEVRGRDTPIAVLPEGFTTIPYLNPDYALEHG